MQEINWESPYEKRWHKGVEFYFFFVKKIIKIDFSLPWITIFALSSLPYVHTLFIIINAIEQLKSQTEIERERNKEKKCHFTL